MYISFFLSIKIFNPLIVIPFIVAKIADLSPDYLFHVSTIMTGVFLFILGVSKSLFTYSKWYFSGLETLSIGAIAAGASYIIGYAFEGLTEWYEI